MHTAQMVGGQAMRHMPVRLFCQLLQPYATHSSPQQLRLEVLQSICSQAAISCQHHMQTASCLQQSAKAAICHHICMHLKIVLSTLQVHEHSPGPPVPGPAGR